MKNYFNPKEVEKIIDVSYRQLQYWDDSNFLKPSLLRKDKFRMYSLVDLIKIDLVIGLRAHGFSIQKIRKTLTKLEETLDNTPLNIGEARMAFASDNIILSSDKIYMDAKAESKHFFYSPSDLMSRVNDFLIKRKSQETSHTSSENQ